MKTYSISITKTSCVYIKKLAVSSDNKTKDINKPFGEILRYLTLGM
jgi:hypothetical protein